MGVPGHLMERKVKCETLQKAWVAYGFKGSSICALKIYQELKKKKKRKHLA